MLNTLLSPKLDCCHSVDSHNLQPTARITLCSQISISYMYIHSGRIILDINTHIYHIIYIYMNNIPIYCAANTIYYILLLLCLSAQFRLSAVEWKNDIYIYVIYHIYIYLSSIPFNQCCGFIPAPTHRSPGGPRSLDPRHLRQAHGHVRLHILRHKAPQRQLRDIKKGWDMANF